MAKVDMGRFASLMLLVTMGVLASGDLSTTVLDGQVGLVPDSLRQQLQRTTCLQSRIPKPAEPTGADDEFIIRNCVESEILAAVAKMSELRHGRMFLRCGRATRILMTKPMELRRLGEYKIIASRGQVTFDGQGQTQLIVMGGHGHLDLYGLVFENGVAGANTSGGGAIEVDWRTNLRATRCVFRNNRVAHTRALAGGGAIGAGGGGLFLWNSVFEDNVAPTGGAVHNTGGNLRANNCFFRRNVAFGGRDGRNIIIANGAAIRVDRMSGIKPLTLKICGCDFEGNHIIDQPGSQNLGGVVTVWGHDGHLPDSGVMADVKRSLFLENGLGGPAPNVLALHGAGDVYLEDLRFIRNRATSQLLRLGSPRFAIGYKVVISQVTFDGDEAGSDGIRFEGAECSMSGVIKDGLPINCR